MPADTYSNILGWLTMGTGNDNNSWGDNANISIFTILEKAIAGYATHAVTGGTLLLDNVIPPTGPTDALEMIHNFSGVLASDQVVQVPNLYKVWIARNNCTGNFTLKFKTLTGSVSAPIPQGGWAFVFCDGNNACSVGLSTSLRDVQWLGADGTVAAPGLSFTGEPTTGIYRKAAGVVGISILGVEIFEISAAGANVTSGGISVGGSQVVPAGVEQAYAGIELPVGGWLWEDGTAYSRTTYATLLGALTKTCTGNTHTSTTLDTLSVDLRGKGLEGAYIEGTGIITGTTIVTINSATSLTLSQAATGTSSGVAIRVLPHGQGDGSTTFNVPDRRYRALVGRDDMNNNNAARSSLYAGKKLSTAGGEETHTLTVAETAAHSHTFTGDALPTHLHSIPYNLNVNQNFGTNGANQATSSGSTNTTAVSAGTPTGTNSSTGGGGAHNTMGPFGITNWIIKT